MRLSGHVARVLGAASLLAALVTAQSPMVPTAVASGPNTSGFSYFRTGLAPLTNPTTRILQGEKLANGACRYQNIDGVMEVPSGGWEERTVALDPIRCRKLIEAGTPTDLTSVGDAGMESARSAALPTAPSAGGAPPLSIQSTQSAYIRVFWMDPVNLKVNQDVTQIDWTYNGATVSNGLATGYWNWLTGTGWVKLDSAVSSSYGPGYSYLLGQTTSDFGNAIFCPLPPIVYTHYYYVRMWGQPNGTAQWSQSSDSVDECFPFHWDKITAYGAFPGF